MEVPVEFNLWVNEHNSPAHLQYGKGWWDYVETVRRLCEYAIDVGDCDSVPASSLRRCLTDM
jgi:hypothetical protein